MTQPIMLVALPVPRSSPARASAVPATPLTYAATSACLPAPPAARLTIVRARRTMSAATTAGAVQAATSVAPTAAAARQAGCARPTAAAPAPLTSRRPAGRTAAPQDRSAGTISVSPPACRLLAVLKALSSVRPIAVLPGRRAHRQVVRPLPYAPLITPSFAGRCASPPALIAAVVGWPAYRATSVAVTTAVLRAVHAAARGVAREVLCAAPVQQHAVLS